jgi:hypothetical protein
MSRLIYSDIPEELYYSTLISDSIIKIKTSPEVHR